MLGFIFTVNKPKIPTLSEMHGALYMEQAAHANTRAELKKLHNRFSSMSFLFQKKNEIELHRLEGEVRLLRAENNALKVLIDNGSKISEAGFKRVSKQNQHLQEALAAETKERKAHAARADDLQKQLNEAKQFARTLVIDG